MNFYIGTYTDMSGEGIVSCTLTGDTLSVTQANLDIPNPNYLIVSPDKQALYAVGGGAKEGWFAFSYDLSGGNPQFLSKQRIEGADPCHLTLSADGRYLYTANYGDGSLSVLPIENKRLLGSSQFIRHTGHSINPTRQEAPHVHQVTFAPDDHTCLHCVDLGLDVVRSYRQDSQTGNLTFSQDIPLVAGGGPRHLAYAKDGRYLYVAHELSSEISFLSRDGEDFAVLQRLSTLPENYGGISSCAAIRIAHDEQKIFVSNRGHDSIAVFDIMEEGFLKLHTIIPSYGRFPRDFYLLPDNRLLIANQNSGTLALVDIKGNLYTSIDVKGCVCVAA